MLPHFHCFREARYLHRSPEGAALERSRSAAATGQVVQPSTWDCVVRTPLSGLSLLA